MSFLTIAGLVLLAVWLCFMAVIFFFNNRGYREGRRHGWEWGYRRGWDDAQANARPSRYQRPSDRPNK
nr:hypothetical protein [uncultured Porphyromonas sp.]